MTELDEILDIVDENNNVVGQATRGECYQKNLLHRAVNIFIYNSKGQLFMHKRSDKKIKFPRYWDLSCSEHVQPGESFDEAAKRGLMEELSIEMDLEILISLHHVDFAFKDDHDNELVVTFKGIFEGEMKFDPSEVADGKFFNPDNLPTPVTPWFLHDWKMIKKDE